VLNYLKINDMKITKFVQDIIDTIFDSTKVRFKYTDYAAILNLDVSKDNDFYIPEITGDITFNLLNAKDGDSGIIEAKMDAVGGYTITFGAMFTKRISEAFDTTASKDNFISWQKIGDDIVYQISQVQ